MDTIDFQERRAGSAIERRLTSDFLLVKDPLSAGDWMVFRDVHEVDGAPLHDLQQQRLLDLFTHPTTEGWALARRIAAESMSYHLEGPSSLVSNPLTVVAVFQDHYREAFHFRRSNEDESLGPNVRIVTFQQRPLAWFGSSPDRPSPLSFFEVRGSASIHEATGRVLKTELLVGAGLGIPRSMTTFGFDERLGVDIPVEMRTSWPDGGMARNQITGVATYQQCRRFEVLTEVTVGLPAD